MGADCCYIESLFLSEDDKYDWGRGRVELVTVLW